MSTRMGEALSGLGVWTVPALGMVGSVLAGSITGSLSMFATTFGSIAHITGAPELPVVAAGMAASGLANGASPARAQLAVTMAVQALPADSALRPADAAERSAMERTVLGWVVGLSAVSAAGVAVALTLTV
jgi:lactate permease